jgi:glutamate dehydrogenase
MNTNARTRDLEPRQKRAIDPNQVECPASYRELVSPRQRARDMLKLGGVIGANDQVFDLRRLPGESDFDLRIYSAEMRALDELIPLLHNLGLPIVDQVQFPVVLAGERRFIRSFFVRPSDCGRLVQSRTRILEALAALLSGYTDEDPLNQLVPLAGLSWKEVDAIRGYCNYYLQLCGRADRARVVQAILREADVTRLLFSYFETRFRPDHAGRDSLDALGEARQRLINALDKVKDIIDDRILRDLFNLIDATLRTNFYSTDRKALAFKIDSLGVMSAPAPKPLVEIFVHSRSMQGIHLRGAKVARGGVRWSDRAHDLRAEILDLMQTQMIKNALIVPQGAKGGFVLKTQREDSGCREELGKAAYREFIGSLLELTDNPDGSGRSDRGESIYYDTNDPYLVVAADKGTGAWSDIANEIARSRGFWLGDAFATGGSNGFHHKRLGITAKGAWVCVRRHFAEIGRDVDEQAFTVIGVGSMDGDVFGNGMLETPNIRLLGAFSGDHIFIDPNPDPLTSYAERRRLFETPHSTWADYDPLKISAGGGVYRRDAKEIELSAQARSSLRARNRLVDGEGLIRILLTTPADLLWMGGVGTYVKASGETDESIGDRANDGARVNADQLRAKVVAEGANLGFTHRARVEYALGGGRINMDAIDNSAGVDLSDHEVNLKILLHGLQQKGGAASADSRDVLTNVTDEVCASVLDDNYSQSLCISLERERCIADAGPYMDVADRFEASGQLDRVNEAFPTRRELVARTEKGLTRPELALLMAYGKLALKRALLEALGAFDAECVRGFLSGYFPAAIRSRYANAMATHPLAHEIIATVICNKIIDQAGVRFLLFGDPLAPTMLIDAVAAYLFFDQVLQGERWRGAVRSLDRKMVCKRQYEYLLQLEDTLAYMCRWALQGVRVRLARPEVDEWRSLLEKYLAYFAQSSGVSILESNAPEASRELFLDRLRDFPLLVDLSRRSGRDIADTARLFEDVAGFLGLRQIAALVAELTARDSWERKLQIAIDERLRSAAARIAGAALRSDGPENVGVFKRAGMASRLPQFQRLRAEIIQAEPKSIAPFALLLTELELMVEAGDAARRTA